MNGKIRNGFGQCRRSVERFRPLQTETSLSGIAAEGDVDVVENLDVVAEKADGLQKESLCAGRGDLIEGFFDGGADPGATARALALEGKPPARNLGDAFGDKFGGVARFIGVGIGASNGPLTRLAFRFSLGLDGAGGHASAR